jgi:creatinine amidohydrolase
MFIIDRIYLEGARFGGVEKARDAGPLVALLPVGSTEAHGPHLPLSTDVIIARGLARAIARRDAGYALLPPIAYAPADTASSFAGTLSIKPETLRALIVDLARELARHRFAALVVVNGHLEPDHVRNLRKAAEEARAAAPALVVLCPEWTSSRFRDHLPKEFFEGGAHAGAYETSLVLASEPSLVDEDARRALAPNPQDLAAHFKAGKRRFEEMPGGDRVYFGDPASATAAMGASINEALARAVDAWVRESRA